MSQPAAAAAASSSSSSSVSSAAQGCEASSISLPLSFLDKSDFHAALQTCRLWHSAAQMATAWPPRPSALQVWRAQQSVEHPFESRLASMRQLSFEVDQQAGRDHLLALSSQPVWSRVPSLVLRSYKQAEEKEAKSASPESSSNPSSSSASSSQSAQQCADDAALEVASRLANLSLLTLTLADPSEAALKKTLESMSSRLVSLRLAVPVALPFVPSLTQLRSLTIAYDDAQVRDEHDYLDERYWWETEPLIQPQLLASLTQLEDISLIISQPFGVAHFVALRYLSHHGSLRRIRVNTSLSWRALCGLTAPIDAELRTAMAGEDSQPSAKRGKKRVRETSDEVEEKEGDAAEGAADTAAASIAVAMDTSEEASAAPASSAAVSIEAASSAPPAAASASTSASSSQASSSSSDRRKWRVVDESTHLRVEGDLPPAALDDVQLELLQGGMNSIRLLLTLPSLRRWRCPLRLDYLWWTDDRLDEEGGRCGLTYWDDPHEKLTDRAAQQLYGPKSPELQQQMAAAGNKAWKLEHDWQTERLKAVVTGGLRRLHYLRAPFAYIAAAADAVSLCSELRELVLCYEHWVSGTCRCALHSGMSSFSIDALPGPPHVSFDGKQMKRIVDGAPNLQHIHLKACGLTSVAFEQLARLQQLEMLELTSVTGFSVEQAQLLASLPRFRHLRLLQREGRLVMSEEMLRAIGNSDSWRRVDLLDMVTEIDLDPEYQVRIPKEYRMELADGWPEQQHPQSALVPSLPYDRLRRLRATYGHFYAAMEETPFEEGFFSYSGMMAHEWSYTLEAAAAPLSKRNTRAAAKAAKAAADKPIRYEWVGVNTRPYKEGGEEKLTF